VEIVSADLGEGEQLSVDAVACYVNEKRMQTTMMMMIIIILMMTIWLLKLTIRKKTM
jgi:hypothetical protein